MKDLKPNIKFLLLLLIVTLGYTNVYSQNKKINLNYASFDITTLYIYSEDEKKNRINYIKGDTLKVKESIMISINIEKKNRSKRVIYVSDNYNNSIKLSGFNPCKDGNIGLTLIENTIPLLIFDNN